MTKPVLTGIVLLFSLVTAQESEDSTETLVPAKAALRSLIPAGGQLYNKKYLKAGLILLAEAFAIYQWQMNAANYRDYEKLSGDLDLPRRRYLEKRNKYAWWIGIIYFYGMLDAVVDAHLKDFNNVMGQEISNETPQTGKEIKEQE